MTSREHEPNSKGPIESRLYQFGRWIIQVSDKCGAAIARASGEPETDHDSFVPNFAPLMLSDMDRTHLELLYEHIHTPAQVTQIIADLQHGTGDVSGQ